MKNDKTKSKNALTNWEDITKALAKESPELERAFRGLSRPIRSALKSANDAFQYILTTNCWRWAAADSSSCQLPKIVITPRGIELHDDEATLNLTPSQVACLQEVKNLMFKSLSQAAQIRVVEITRATCGLPALPQ